MMTIEELYIWGKEHDCLDYDIEVRCHICGDKHYVYCPTDDELNEVIDKKAKNVLL